MLTSSYALRRSSLQRIAEGFLRKNGRPRWIAATLVDGGDEMVRLMSSSECIDSSTDSSTDAPFPSYDYTIRNKRPLYIRAFQGTTPQSSILHSLADLAMGGFPNDEKPGAEVSMKDTQEEKQELLEALLNATGSVNVDAFAHVLTSMSTHKQTGLARRAEMWIKRLEDRLVREATETPTNCSGQWQPLFPNDSIESILVCYAFAIQAWADAIGDDPIVAVNRAEKWLEKAKTISAQAAPIQIQSLMTKCYNAYLDACSKGRGSKAVRRKAARIHAQKAEDTLTFMLNQRDMMGVASPVVPNTDSFNFVMRGIIQLDTDKAVASRTARLLKFMEDSVVNNDQPENTAIVIQPNPKSYCLWLKSLAIVAQQKAHSSRHKSQNLDGLEEIKNLQNGLNHMVSLFQKGRSGVFEDTVPYNTFLAAWARVSGKLNGVDAPMQAEKAFRAMVELSENGIPEVAPDSTSYLQVSVPNLILGDDRTFEMLKYLQIIRAWAKSGSDRGGEKAGFWLDKQWKNFEEHKREDMMPTTRTYIAVISAWGSVSNGDEAERVFLDYLQRYKKLKDPQLKPNAEIFTAIIRAWLQAAESPAGGQDAQIVRLSRAVEWLDNMIKEETKGGVTTTHDLFLHVLKSASSCAVDSPKVLDMAYDTFSNLRNSRHYVDPKSYAWLLEVALLALARPEYDEVRTSFVTRLVKACQEDGLVSKHLVLALTASKVYPKGWTKYECFRITHELFPDWPLPPSWTRNVKRQANLPRIKDF